MRFLGYAEEVINHVIAAENFLKSYRLNNLHLGVATTLTPYLTPIIDKFKELYPSVRVSVREGPSLTLIEDLLDFKFDLCLVGTLQAINKKLQRHPLPGGGEDGSRGKSRLSGRQEGRCQMGGSRRHPLILQSEGSTARAIMLKHFEERNLIPLIGAEVDNIECAKELARQKKGVALMFLPNVREEVAQKALAIIPITDGDITLGIDIAQNEEMATSPVVEAFLGVIQEHFGRLLSQKTS